MSLKMWKDEAADDPFWTVHPIFQGASTRKLYQGASVGAHEAGLFVADEDKDWFVRHNDVTSMYPSIMRLCNFSPETMTLKGTAPYSGKTVLSPTLVQIPDNRIGKDLVIEIADFDGVSRIEMSKLMELRAKYKAEKADSSEKAMKLAANASYGYNGMKFARYGSFLVAIATCGVGRLIMDTIVGIGHDLPDVTVLENDTDGVYTYGPDFLPDIRKALDEIFKEFPQEYAIGIDSVKYFGMLCTGNMKNYSLRKEYKNIIKGNSLKGRGMPGVCKLALEWTLDALFERESVADAWSKIVDHLGVAPLSDFEMSCEVGKEREEYSETTMYAKILKQAPWMRFGEELRYVRVKGMDYHYMPLGSHPDDVLMNNIDQAYYLKRTKTAVARLLEPVRQSDPAVDQLMKAHFDKKKRREKKK
jgi:DNA polymerase elongation subunit (family B)